MKNGKDAGDNPWNALTPEWLTSSPPPVENWDGEAPLDKEPYGNGKEISEQKYINMTTLDSSKEIQINISEVNETHEDFRMFGLITFLIADLSLIHI